LCHTGLVWSRQVDGRTLHFHLAGIKNQNFIMRDEETGSWWQQITGCALEGPLQGRCLEPVTWDEVTYAVWRREHPGTQVLLPVAERVEEYAGKDWEKEIDALPLVTPKDPADALAPRDVVVGLVSGAAATAFPWRDLRALGSLEGVVGDAPVLLVLHPDGLSLRCFDRRVDGRTLDLFRPPCGPPSLGPDELLRDRETGSGWDFSGEAQSGTLAGKSLRPIACLKDDWFDWKLYHPRGEVAQASATPSGTPVTPAPAAR
jgi:hypothetical protein